MSKMEWRPLGGDMPYEQAMFWLERDGDVRRKSWPEGKVVRRGTDWVASDEDKQATDWEHWVTVEAEASDGQVRAVLPDGELRLELKFVPSLGQQLVVYTLGEDIIDPETKENLGALEMLRGFGKVTSVQPVVVTGDFTGAKMGDLVRKYETPKSAVAAHSPPLVLEKTGACPHCGIELVTTVTMSADAPATVAHRVAHPPDTTPKEPPTGAGA